MWIKKEYKKYNKRKYTRTIFFLNNIAMQRILINIAALETALALRLLSFNNKFRHHEDKKRSHRETKKSFYTYNDISIRFHKIYGDIDYLLTLNYFPRRIRLTISVGSE